MQPLLAFNTCLTIRQVAYPFGRITGIRFIGYDLSPKY
jgi:hypothetical protein